MMERCTFMMEKCTFMDFKTEIAIHCHYKALKIQDIFFYITLIVCIRLKEESHTHPEVILGV